MRCMLMETRPVVGLKYDSTSRYQMAKVFSWRLTKEAYIAESSHV